MCVGKGTPVIQPFTMAGWVAVQQWLGVWGFLTSQIAHRFTVVSLDAAWSVLYDKAINNLKIKGETQMAQNLQVENALGTTVQSVKDQNGNTSPLTLSTDKAGIAGSILLTTSSSGVGGNLYFTGTTDAGAIGMRLFGPNIHNQFQSGFIDVRAGTLTDGLIFRVDTFLAGAERMRITATGNVGINTPSPTEKLEVNGNIVATGDIRLLNADCAEEFEICDTEQVEPGTVMVLGEGGKLQQSQNVYDKCVVGVISGAGDYKPGIVLDKQESRDTRKPIALLGKVFCKVDAQYGAIKVGDLLTTSPTPGHAMKADDPIRAFGAVIGKALQPLLEGLSLIPILIALQ